MRELQTPKWGYAFMRNDGTGSPILAIHLGIGDSLDNYHEITKAEYDAILAEQESKEM